MDTCRNTIDEALADRDSYLKKFCEYILHNINDLKKDVNEIRQEAMVLDFFYLFLKLKNIDIFVLNANFQFVESLSN